VIGLCSLKSQRIKNLIAFPFIHDGIPILYYGMPSLLIALGERSLKYLKVRSKVTPVAMTPPIAKRKPSFRVTCRLGFNLPWQVVALGLR
jgi:hypothetical protein